MGGRHEKPGMLKTRIQLEVVQRYEDDDRELAQYKMDTKSRPSWKTIAKRMNRTVESCQARWQWHAVAEEHAPGTFESGHCHRS